MVSAIRSGERGSGHQNRQLSIVDHPQAVPPVQEEAVNHNSDFVEFDGETFGIGEDPSGEMGSFAASKTSFVPAKAVDKVQHSPGDESAAVAKKRTKHRHRASFIHFDDDELDFDAASFPSPPQPSSPIQEEPQDIDPFASMEDLSHSSIKCPRLDDIGSGFDGYASIDASDLANSLPIIVLTSGESIAADIVLGSEAPQSKVLDAIRSEFVLSEVFGSGDLSILREDAVFR